MSKLLEIFQEHCQDHEERLQEKTIAIAVSGGADSMALTLLFKEISKKLNFKIKGITVDHGLRKEAKEEAEKVKEWLKKHAIEHHILTPKKTIPEANIQNWARELRYKFMTDFCKKHNIETLCIAHHQDDQAETVLMRLLRGSGIDGLSAMETFSTMHGITVWRPLLTTEKNELTHYLSSQSQPWIEDPSNNDQNYDRIKIRTLLNQLPENRLIKKRLTDTAAHMRRAKSHLDSEINFIFSRLERESNKKIEVERALFVTLHSELQLRLLRKIIKSITSKKKSPRFEKLQRLQQDLLEDNFTGATLAGCQFSKVKSGIIEVTAEEKKK